AGRQVGPGDGALIAGAHPNLFEPGLIDPTLALVGSAIDAANPLVERCAVPVACLVGHSGILYRRCEEVEENRRRSERECEEQNHEQWDAEHAAVVVAVGLVAARDDRRVRRPTPTVVAGGGRTGGDMRQSGDRIARGAARIGISGAHGGAPPATGT